MRTEACAGRFFCDCDGRRAAGIRMSSLRSVECEVQRWEYVCGVPRGLNFHVQLILQLLICMELCVGVLVESMFHDFIRWLAHLNTLSLTCPSLYPFQSTIQQCCHALNKSFIDSPILDCNTDSTHHDRCLKHQHPHISSTSVVQMV